MTLTDLSPAALATWNAFLEHSEWEVTPAELKGLAAALRAAALYCKRDTLIILSLADELEGAGA
jgi:hypothetical protein